MIRGPRQTESPDLIGFRLRGREVTRLESFSDAVFGFALTLLVVSLDVPKSFHDLVTTIRGFPAFALCFLFLALIWNGHYKILSSVRLGRRHSAVPHLRHAVPCSLLRLSPQVSFQSQHYQFSLRCRRARTDDWLG